MNGVGVAVLPLTIDMYLAVQLACMCLTVILQYCISELDYNTRKV